MITQLFFSNWILLLSVTTLDKYLLEDKIERSQFGYLAGLWALVSFATIPVWLLYIIWSVFNGKL